MEEEVLSQIEALKAVSTPAIEEKYKGLLGKTTAPNNRTYLIRQLAYRMQELTYGGVSGETKTKIEELVKTYNPINKAVSKSSGKTESGRDTRLPLPGSFITKKYKDKRIEVKVLEDGFEYQGSFYKNLTAVAQKITGAHWNGFMFFGLRKNGKN